MPNTLTLLLLASNGSSIDDIRRFVGDRNGASYAVAEMIMKVVDWILGIFGLDHNQTVVTFLYAAVVLCVALVVGRITQWIVLHLVREITKHWSSDMYEALKSVNFFHKICRIIPALVFLVLIEFALSNHTALSTTLSKLTLIYVVFVTAVALSAVIVAVWQHIDRRANKRKLPLTGLAQLAKGIVWIVAAIVIICILIDQSPGRLLAGLGAFAAVLMLVFKDSILGLVAGVQLSENDSLHVGDWVAVPGTNANGTVMEVGLTAVKVLNWDKTTTTLPPYSLISSGFTNYRSMQESNTRRICRCYYIDADSVLPATAEMIERVRKLPYMDEWISKKQAQAAAGKDADVANPEGLADGTLDTNLGMFRAYFKMWLDHSKYISHDSDCFVSTLGQTSAGIPFQVYCFTATSKWFPYEGIQDLVFEHLAAMLGAFQLYAFENPSGRDTVVDGYLSPGRSIDDVFGVPYPFFQDPTSPDSPSSTRPKAKTAQTPPQAPSQAPK